MSKFLAYLLRWQASTIILWPVIQYLPIESVLEKTIIANIIGGCIFFNIDRLIFGNYKTRKKNFIRLLDFHYFFRRRIDKL